jgi:hypothetical protein
MIPHQFFYLIVVLGLLWIFFMLHVAWPSQGGVTPQRPGEPEPIKPRRIRSKEPHPFAGLPQKPLIGPNGVVTLARVTIQGGNCTTWGQPCNAGGITVYKGTLTLTDSTVRGNTGNFGGGLENIGGMLTLKRCTVSENFVSGPGGECSGASSRLAEATMHGNTRRRAPYGQHKAWASLVTRAPGKRLLAASRGPWALAARTAAGSRQAKGNGQGVIELRELGRRQGAHIIGEDGFGHTDQRVAVDGARLLEPFVHPDHHLALETVVGRIHRGTEHGGGAGLNKRRATDDDEHARPPGVVTRGPEDTVQLPSPHGASVPPW